MHTIKFITKEEDKMRKCSLKWILEKKYSNHYSFRVENEYGKVMWHESFHTIEEAQNAIPKWALYI